jgi:hypothetical protein
MIEHRLVDRARKHMWAPLDKSFTMALATPLISTRLIEAALSGVNAILRSRYSSALHRHLELISTIW